MAYVTTVSPVVWILSEGSMLPWRGRQGASKILCTSGLSGVSYVSISCPGDPAYWLAEKHAKARGLGEGRRCLAF